MDGLAEALQTAYAGVQWAGQDLGEQIHPRLVISPTTPCIDIYPADIPRETESAGFNVSGVDGGIMFTVRARVSTADSDSGQELLIAFMDDEHDLSLAAALMADETLGGVAVDVTVDQPTGFGLYPDPGGQGSLLGAQWRVTVMRNTDVT